MQNLYSRSGTFGWGTKATSTCTGGLGVGGHRYMYRWPRAGATVYIIYTYIYWWPRVRGAGVGLRALGNFYQIEGEIEDNSTYSMVMRVSAQGVAQRLAIIFLLLASVLRSCVASASFASASIALTFALEHVRCYGSFCFESVELGATFPTFGTHQPLQREKSHAPRGTVAP